MEQLYRGLRTSNAERTNLRGYYTHQYPAALLARYFWPAVTVPLLDDETPLPTRRILKMQGMDGKYGKNLEPWQLEPTASALRELLVQGQPAALHMGAVATCGRYMAASNTCAYELEHEIFIDLDLRDWEHHRPGTRSKLCSCGSEEACRECWALVVLAAAVCRTWLGDVLGLGPMLVVYSGGKGAHFHFGTRTARQLTAAQRRHLARQLQDSNEDTRRAVAHALPGTPLGRIGDAVIRAWQGLAAVSATAQSHILSPAAANTLTRSALLTHLLYFAWPVADMAVVDDPGQHRTVKAPFSVHAKTRRLALPLATTGGDMCDPATMPTVDAVVDAHAAGRHLPAWQAAVDAMEAWLAATAS